MRIVGLILISWLISGCSTLSVVTEYAENEDLSKLKTYHYKESSINFADTYPHAHRLVVNDIRGEMISAGLAEVDTVPDVYVTYYGEENEKIVIRTVQKEYSTPGMMFMSPGGRANVGSLHSPTPIEVLIREGTLVIDMWTTDDKELVWRAEISDTISGNPERNMANIKKGIFQAFEDFPPPSGL